MKHGFFVNFFALQLLSGIVTGPLEASSVSKLRMKKRSMLSIAGQRPAPVCTLGQSLAGEATGRRAGSAIEIMNWMQVVHPLTIDEGKGKAAMGVAALALSFVACAPALDWREALIEGPGLTATFPCRPIGQRRDVALAGTLVQMRLQACEAAGSTFAIGVVDVGDPARIAGAMAALRESTLGKLPASSQAVASALAGWSVAGATPQPGAGRWQSRGERPDHSSLSLDTAVFSRGTWVIQATLIAGRSDPNQSEPFFDGLRFAP